MISSEQQRFDALYDRHLRALKLHGYSASTIDVYARAVRRVAEYFDHVPDHLSTEQLVECFSELVESHLLGKRAGRKNSRFVVIRCELESFLSARVVIDRGAAFHVWLSRGYKRTGENNGFSKKHEC